MGYLVWKERRKGQSQPSRLETAKNKQEAMRKARNSKFPYTYVINVNTAKATQVRGVKK